MDQESQLNTPFLRKLNHILSDSSLSQLISWDSTGTMIDILDQKRISSEILPKFFRHNKFESFIRQLNLYGFRKIKKLNIQRFRHPDLVKGNSIFSIRSQRKNKNPAEQRSSNELVEEVQVPPIIGKTTDKINSVESGKMPESNYNLNNYNLNPQQQAMNQWWLQTLQIQMMMQQQSNMQNQLAYSQLNQQSQPLRFPHQSLSSNNIFFYN